MIIATLPPPLRPIALAIYEASRFVEGFEGDETQQGVQDLQDTLRRAVVVLERTGRLVELVFGMTFTTALVDGVRATTVSDAQINALRDACLTLRDGPSFPQRGDATDNQVETHRTDLAEYHRQTAERQGGRHLVAAGDRDHSLPGAIAYLTINGVAYGAKLVAEAVLRADNIAALIKADEDYDAAWEDWTKFVLTGQACEAEDKLAASRRVSAAAARRRDALARLSDSRQRRVTPGQGGALHG